ncbi:type II restriction endonuclease [Uliginosibacterium sp. H3]|uniref:Type II restriction endonuclease n=1 Tax=Uliginosibacterium silvisoli TaxID=3114758 RepID=A0ABU6JZ29_9RHOO|nr:type II restriction endonuclease [Uliginosibacterium sp. H3]
MFSDSIADYFEGVAAKHLSAVDASKKKGVHKQHEIGGLPEVGFRQYLGSPSKDEKLAYPARLVYLSDTEDAPTVCEDTLTWYDVRWKHPTRSAEYRLYYRSNAVTAMFSEGDFFLIGKRTDGSLLLVFCPPESTAEAQLRAVFGLDTVGDSFSKGVVSASSLLLPVRLLLEDLGLITAEQDEQGKWLDLLLGRFGGETFPATAAFSMLARETLKGDFDPVADPDAALMAWMDHEEFLFRIYERHIVQQRLRQGFGADGDDVDEFISYSLSVQNRRKSRVGHAFEGHLEELFATNNLLFERARGKGKVTENNAKPDFLFPGFAAYHDSTFPAQRLTMLGAKTTCKDRWRQVLAEADRVEKKHLVTLEPAISSAQTDEMASAFLQLVVPASIQTTYSEKQRGALQRIGEFIAHVKAQ